MGAQWGQASHAEQGAQTSSRKFTLGLLEVQVPRAALGIDQWGAPYTPTRPGTVKGFQLFLHPHPLPGRRTVMGSRGCELISAATFIDSCKLNTYYFGSSLGGTITDQEGQLSGMRQGQCVQTVRLCLLAPRAAGGSCHSMSGSHFRGERRLRGNWALPGRGGSGSFLG